MSKEEPKEGDIPTEVRAQAHHYWNIWKKCGVYKLEDKDKKSGNNKLIDLKPYKEQERIIREFFNKHPENDCVDIVTLKIGALDSFYSTNLNRHGSAFRVAEHIVCVNGKSNIYERLKEGNLDLVNKIAKVEDIYKKSKTLYSFATKYCHHHFSKDSEALEQYPIYDSLVVKMLKHYKNKNESFTFNEGDLKEYTKYREILLRFRKCYGLEKNDFPLRKLDKYLWLAGKDYTRIKNLK